MNDKVVCGDCLNVMKRLPDACVDAIVTDPPYGLSFMGRDWDHGVPGVPFWTEALRVAKPGAHLVAFGGTRTYHRLACAIEDAGWEVRDSIGFGHDPGLLAYCYGTGFPKSLDVGTRTAPATDAAKQWDGWGTALKPAWEPIILARKPLVGTVAANVLKYGTGGINVDACRIGISADDSIHAKNPHTVGTIGANGIYGSGEATLYKVPHGRWPANVALDEEAAAMLDGQSGTSTSAGKAQFKPRSVYSADAEGYSITGKEIGYGDSGGASRFFYTAKVSRSERTMRGAVDNKHPTVKPVSLMRWLVRMVTPPQGSVLDPFAGSGTTLLAAHLEGFDYLGIEREAEYVEIIRKRLARVEDLR